MNTSLGKEIFTWLKESWQLLTRQLEQDNLPHALLLNGPEGIGKSHFALQFTAYLLCDNRQNQLPCGNCKSCHLLKAGSHPDFLDIFPEEEGKAIKVDQVREINHFAAQTAQLGGYRVIMINPADALNINAANALLKNLEEPGAKSLFILISSQPSGLSATIRSRCNSLDLPLPAPPDAHNWLEGHLCESSQLDATQLLKLANGAPLQALSYSEGDFLEDRAKRFAGITALQNGQSSAMEVAQQWQGLDLLATLNWINDCITDLVKISLSGDESQVKSLDYLEFLKATAEQVSVNKLYLYRDRLIEAKRGLLSGNNPNKILLLEELLMRWSGCFSQGAIKA